MNQYETRYYRYWHKKGDKGLYHYEVHYKQTNLWIRSKNIFMREAFEAVIKSHRDILEYAAQNPSFLSALLPLPEDPLAPPIVKKMLQGSLKADVGPMAGVAGAIAERVGFTLLRHSPDEVIVENGGDCFISSSEDALIGIYAKSLKAPLKIKIRRDQMPLAVCTSSSSIGHSLSFGKVEAATILSKDGAFADCAATALANSISKPEDVKPALENWIRHPDVIAAIATIKNIIGVVGDIELMG